SLHLIPAPSRPTRAVRSLVDPTETASVSAKGKTTEARRLKLYLPARLVLDDAAGLDSMPAPTATKGRTRPSFFSRNSRAPVASHWRPPPNAVVAVEEAFPCGRWEIKAFQDVEKLPRAASIPDVADGTIARRAKL